MALSLAAVVLTFLSVYNGSSTTQAVRESLPVLVTFKDGNDTKAVVKSESGERFAVSVKDTQSKTVDLYRAEKKTGETFAQGCVQVGETSCYGVEKPHVEAVQNPLHLLPLSAAAFSLTLPFFVIIAGNIECYSVKERYPALELRKIRGGRFDTESAKFGDVGFAVTYMAAMINLGMISAPLIARMWHGENGPYVLPLAVVMTAIFTFVIAVILAKAPKSFSTEEAIAARICWGRAKNTPALAYCEKLDVWPNTWAAKQGADVETIEALNPEEFEGTLGELVNAAKNLGPE